MKELLAQLKGITHLFASGEKRSEKTLHPARDWHLLLVATFVLFVGLSVYSLTTFYGSGEQVTVPVATSTQATILRQQDLRSALELYRERLTVLETLRREVGEVPLPGAEPVPVVESTEPENGTSIEAPAFD